MSQEFNPWEFHSSISAEPSHLDREPRRVQKLVELMMADTSRPEEVPIAKLPPVPDDLRYIEDYPSAPFDIPDRRTLDAMRLAAFWRKVAADALRPRAKKGPGRAKEWPRDYRRFRRVEQLREEAARSGSPEPARIDLYHQVLREEGRAGFAGSIDDKLLEAARKADTAILKYIGESATDYRKKPKPDSSA